ncbi:hypothetical protein [Lacticaseibacillus kribbianus]|uniref:hypothetical protein n=1 Tax=Lacticaseibacillus kribbianus TaxID=2926292 RepID=UPI001CD8189E|nr:hypothetical protein [Lacticaseibacillus kribbianus]
MAELALLFPEWNALDDKARQFAAAQLGRYFLSPLLAVDAIEPVTVATFGQTLHTFDFLIAGEWLRFVPGAAGVPLGVTWPLPEPMQAVGRALGLNQAAAENHLSPAGRFDLPPMLVARTPIESALEVIGQLDFITGKFRGNLLAYTKLAGSVQSLLTPGPDGSLPPVIETDQLRLRQASATAYQVALKHDWDLPQLQHRLGGFGFALANEREYEYLMGGGFPQLFAWGNQLPGELNFVPNRFGLTVPLRRPGSELIAEGWAKSRALAGQPTGQGRLALSPFYRATPGPFAKTMYRKIVRIAL